MNITECRQYEPLFGGWKVTRMWKGTSVPTFTIVRDHMQGEAQSLLLVVAIPRDLSALHHVFGAVLTQQIEETYLQGVLSVCRESLEKLKDPAKKDTLYEAGILPCEEYEIRERDDDTGWDMLIRTPYMMPLSEYKNDHGITQREADLLRDELQEAIKMCRRQQLSFPAPAKENVLVSQEGKFFLSCFGCLKEEAGGKEEEESKDKEPEAGEVKGEEPEKVKAEEVKGREPEGEKVKTEEAKDKGPEGERETAEQNKDKGSEEPEGEEVTGEEVKNKEPEGEEEKDEEVNGKESEGDKVKEELPDKEEQPSEIKEKEQKDGKPKETTTRRKRWQWYVVAAAAVICVIAVLAGRRASSTKNGSETENIQAGISGTTAAASTDGEMGTAAQASMREETQASSPASKNGKTETIASASTSEGTETATPTQSVVDEESQEILSRLETETCTDISLSVDGNHADIALGESFLVTNHNTYGIVLTAKADFLDDNDAKVDQQQQAQYLGPGDHAVFVLYTQDETAVTTQLSFSAISWQFTIPGADDPEQANASASTGSADAAGVLAGADTEDTAAISGSTNETDAADSGIAAGMKKIHAFSYQLVEQDDTHATASVRNTTSQTVRISLLSCHRSDNGTVVTTDSQTKTQEEADTQRTTESPTQQETWTISLSDSVTLQPGDTAQLTTSCLSQADKVYQMVVPIPE